MLVGYVRVSTESQKLDTQEKVMDMYDVSKVFREKTSAMKDLEGREQFWRMMDYLRKGDTVVVYDLSRLTRSLLELENIIKTFEDQEIDLISHMEPFDIHTPMGKFMARMMTIFNDFQIDQNNTKIREALVLAKANGKQLGRRPISESKIKRIKQLTKEGLSNQKIADLLGVSRRTVIKYKK